jgi:hypothetical protein
MLFLLFSCTHCVLKSEDHAHARGLWNGGEETASVCSTHVAIVAAVLSVKTNDGVRVLDCVQLAQPWSYGKLDQAWIKITFPLCEYYVDRTCQ